VRIDLDGRFMLPGGEEHPCRVVEASTGEMVLATPVSARCGDRVVVYVSELGRFEGDVEHPVAAGFAISLSLTHSKHRRLAEQLTWLANRDLCDLPETRCHRRIVPRMAWTRVRMPDGKEKVARINDFSLVSISIETAAEVSVGDRVAFGVKSAVVKRLLEGGFVADFEEAFADGEVTEETRF
jgi:hypothetical protein